MYLLVYLKLFLKVYFSILFLILLYHQFSVKREMLLFGTDWGRGLRSFYSQLKVRPPIAPPPQYSEPCPPPPTPNIQNLPMHMQTVHQSMLWLKELNRIVILICIKRSRIGKSNSSSAPQLPKHF